MPSAPDNQVPPALTDKVKWVTERDRRSWVPLYPEVSRKRQRVEGWILFGATLVTIAGFYFVWGSYTGKLRTLALAGLGGLLGGLLQDAKFFYKSVGDGNWIWDKSWWRLLTPVMASAMGFSVYLIFRAGTFMSSTGAVEGKEDYYSYGIGFLVGLFADNALQKLRDIAYTLFGPTKKAEHAPHSPKSGAVDNPEE